MLGSHGREAGEEEGKDGEKAGAMQGSSKCCVHVLSQREDRCRRADAINTGHSVVRRRLRAGWWETGLCSDPVLLL